MADAFQHPPSPVDVKLLVRKYRQSGRVLVPVVAVFILGMDSRPGVTLTYGQYMNLLDDLQFMDDMQRARPWAKMVDLEYTGRQLLVFHSDREEDVERRVVDALEAQSVHVAHVYKQHR